MPAALPDFIIIFKVEVRQRINSSNDYLCYELCVNIEQKNLIFVYKEIRLPMCLFKKCYIISMAYTSSNNYQNFIIKLC